MPKFNRVYLSKFEQPEFIADLRTFPFDPKRCRGMNALRRYAKPERVIVNCRTDFRAALALARFTSRAWRHDGFNSRPKRQDALTILKLADKGASFACVQFASVFVQLCHSVGIPARIIQAQTRSPGFGSSGNGHVTAEYFDSQLAKWVWIDPQIHAYATHRKIPLSQSELAEMYGLGKKPKLHFSSRTLEYVGGDRKHFKILRAFVKRYTWVTRVGALNPFYTSQKSVRKIACQRGSGVPSITFQGFADAMPTYLPRAIFDAPLNVCQLRLETIAPGKLVSWKNLEDYRANAHKNFARDKVRVWFDHSMPWFSHYRVSLNGRTWRVKTSSVILRLKKGANNLEVGPVNEFGRQGVSSKAVIRFDNKYKAVKSYW